MRNLETIVRPFQAFDVFNARVAPPVQPARPEADEPVEILIEGSNAGQFIEEPPPYVMNLSVEWQEDRSKRNTSEVRVENPDDPTQYVDVERIDSATFVNNKTSEQMKMNMDWGND